jgi:hypothetical protein
MQPLARTSLLVAGVRGTGGCEVLAIWNLVLRRRDPVGGVVFSPVDEIETRLSQARLSREDS